jgi:hypothetical protein
MQPNEVLPFLRHANQVQSMADKVSTALCIAQPTEAARHVVYSGGQDPNEFVVTVLGKALTARLEYFKFHANDKDFLAGQFYFTHIVGDKEQRLRTVLRMIPPGDIFLPDDKHFDLDDLDMATGLVVSMRDKLSVALLAEQVEGMSSWSLN